MTKNLYCPVCGYVGLDIDKPGFRQCPVSDCPVHQFKIHGTRPDPLHERFKSYLEGRLNRYHIQKGIERMDKIRPIDENDNAKYIEAKCIYNEFNRIFGENENGN